MSPEFGDEPRGHEDELPAWDDPMSNLPPQDNEFIYEPCEVEKQGRKTLTVRLPMWVQKILKTYTTR